ncbi:uncharacterized protein zgc:112980 isoform X2 [Triplophysa rosa]|nr:uncharacterized protein zgc:112980 isoform X2 [Triplophysa rosa]
MCEFWTTPGICHCNAHKHSMYWKALRYKSLMGYLHELNFAFDPLDMDSDLRHAETSLKKFAGSLAMNYAVFMMGCGPQKTSVSCRCNCHCINDNTVIQAGCKGCQKHHLKVLSFDYSPVSQHIQMFLQEAMKENPKACIVMLLGAVKIFISHTAPGNTHAAFAVSDAVTLLQWRIITKVWMLLVSCDFSSSFAKQLEAFYQRLPLLVVSPLPKSLHVLPWDDPLLSAVIKGQNISGERHVKGRRLEILSEPLGLIEARVCRLEQLNKYRELARYLKVVKSHNIPQLQRLKDLVPLYLCKVGEYSAAVNALLSPVPCAPCPASRLTPPQFRAYLRIFTSGHAPKIENPQSDSRNVNTIMPDHLLAAEWTPVEGSNLLKGMEVLKFALRVLNCNNAVFSHTESWVYLLSVVSCSHIAQDGLVVAAFYDEPDANFQMVTRGIASSILQELTATSEIEIPKTFENGYPDQARLLLATQALVLRILHSQFSPVLTVILSFRFNRWALRTLYFGLLVRPDVLHYLLCCVVEELSRDQYQSKRSESDHSLISYFLCLFFLENDIVLTATAYPTNTLLATWNEVHFPWQNSLRTYLECNIASLSKEKCQILQQIQLKAAYPHPE